MTQEQLNERRRYLSSQKKLLQQKKEKLERQISGVNNELEMIQSNRIMIT